MCQGGLLQQHTNTWLRSVCHGNMKNVTEAWHGEFWTRRYITWLWRDWFQLREPSNHTTIFLIYLVKKLYWKLYLTDDGANHCENYSTMSYCPAMACKARRIQLILRGVYYFWRCHDKSAADRWRAFSSRAEVRCCPLEAGWWCYRTKRTRRCSGNHPFYTMANSHGLFRDLQSQKRGCV